MHSYRVHPLISVSTEKCCLAVSDRTSTVISVRTEVTEVDICLGHLCMEIVRRWDDRQDDQVQGGPAERRAIGVTTKIPPVCREGVGTLTVLNELDRGGGADRRIQGNT